jgi:nicotinamide riboside kinase
MTLSLMRALEQLGTPFLVVDGPDEARRLATAVQVIDSVLDKGWRLGVPLEYAG